MRPYHNCSCWAAASLAQIMYMRLSYYYPAAKRMHMEQSAIFSAVLGLSSPWQITALTFSNSGKRLDLTIDFPVGSSFSCPKCGSLATVIDSCQESWHHDDFFRFTAYLHARVPRLLCSVCSTESHAELPWCRTGSKFTTLN